jgi:hypothetical protein
MFDAWQYSPTMIAHEEPTVREGGVSHNARSLVAEHDSSARLSHVGRSVH